MQRYPRRECSPEQNGKRCGYDQMSDLQMEGGINSDNSDVIEICIKRSFLKMKALTGWSKTMSQHQHSHEVRVP